MLAQGSFTYTPNHDYKGPDAFWYRPVNSANGTLALTPHCHPASCSTAKYAIVNINVTDPPPPLVARGVNDSVNATEDTNKTIDPATLMANDINAFRIIYVQHSFFQADSVRTDHETLTMHYADFIPGFPSRYVSSIDYAPDANYNGPDSFRYFDSTGYNNGWDVSDYTGTVALNVAPVSDPPHASTNSGNTAFGAPVTIDVTTNDTDPEGDLDLTSLGHDPDPCANQPQHIPSCDNDDPSGWNLLAHGTWQPHADGTITYTPTPGFIGTAVWPYQICDATHLCDQATVAVVASSVGDDTYDTNEDTPLNVGAPGVLANDKPGVIATVGTTPAHGTLRLNGNGSFTYAPAANFNGTDTFTYTIGTAHTATVTIHVAAVNDAPNLFLNGYCDHSIPGIVCLTEDERDITEGGTATLNGSITDPEFDSGTMTIGWGDGTSTSATYPCSGTDCPFTTNPTYSSLCVGGCGNPIYFRLTHTYADDPSDASPYYTISGSAVDAHDATGTKTAGARVTNVAPSMTVSPEGCALCIGSYSNLSVALGEQASIAGRITDPGPDTGSLTIDWGDGSAPSTVALGCGSATEVCPTPAIQSPTCASPTTLGPGCGYFDVPHTYALGGDYTVHLTTTDDDGGSTSADAAAHVQSTTVVAPTATIAGVATYRNTTTVPLSWSATAGSGLLTGYDVRYRRAPWNGSFGGYTMWQTGTPTTSGVFPGSAGNTYCFSVIAHAADGGVSAPTPETCTIVPLDERSFSRSGTWKLGTSSAYYRNTYARSTKSGATLTRTRVFAKRIAIVVTTCPSCGKVRVYWGSTLLKTVNLKSATTVNKKLITIKTFSSARHGTLKLRVYGGGKKVLIDGVAIGRN